MSHPATYIRILLSVSVLSVLFSILYHQPARGGTISEQRKGELINMIRHDCGSCHGMTLKGGLGPPLTPDALIDKNHGLLYNTIVYGRENTAMPPWLGLLSEEEIEWIVVRLREGDLDAWRKNAE